MTWTRGGGGEGEVLWPGPGGREVLWPGPRGGREVLWPGPRGEGRCCDLVPGGGRCGLVLGRGREVLWPGPGQGEGGVVTWSQGGGGVVTWSWGEGRCYDLVPGGCVVTCSQGEGGVVTWSQGGREVLWPGPGVKGGVVTWSLVAHLAPRVGQTDACENITFATRAVKILGATFRDWRPLLRKKDN